MDYLRSRVKKEWSGSESKNSKSDDEDGGNEDEEDNNYDKDEESDSSNEKLQREDIAQAGVSEDTHAEDPEDPSSTFKDEKGEVLETGRLFVRNLPHTAIEDELEEHFIEFGNISQLHLVVDNDTRHSKGLVCIQSVLVLVCSLLTFSMFLM